MFNPDRYTERTRSGNHHHDRNRTENVPVVEVVPVTLVQLDEESVPAQPEEVRQPPRTHPPRQQRRMRLYIHACLHLIANTRTYIHIHEHNHAFTNTCEWDCTCVRARV